MGKRGPAPIPMAVRRLRGTDKTHPERRAPRPLDVPAGAPARPRHLVGVARKTWDDLAPRLVELGVLTPLDSAALEGLCVSYAHAVAADALLQRDGLVVAGGRGRKSAHPALAASLQAWASVKRFASELGVTPAARTRVNAPPGPPPVDEAGFVFGGPRPVPATAP